MNAIKKVRKFLEANPQSKATDVLKRLVAALGDEEAFPLSELYLLDYEAFDMAIDLLKDWRLDRYYASRLKLFDAAHWPGVESKGEDAQH